MDHDDDGETSYNALVDDVAFEPTYPQALLTAAGRNVATQRLTSGEFGGHSSLLINSLQLVAIHCSLEPTLPCEQAHRPAGK